MSIDYRTEAPQVVRDFLTYNETIRGRSPRTVGEYYLDLKTFLRYMKILKKCAPADAQFDEIPINDINIDFIKTITLSDIYDYLTFISRERPTHWKSEHTTYGNSAASRARKVAALRSFFKYLEEKAHLIDDNPAKNLDAPKIKQSLPRHLSVDEGVELLSSVDGQNSARDFCILTFFLNCGLRVSELVNINIGDIQGDRLRILGKGNKERVVYLNDACIDAFEQYLSVRIKPEGTDRNALFVSRQRRRISAQTVKALTQKYLKAAGLGDKKYSAHKLRHTAATLMFQNGVDIRTIKDFLGHETMDMSSRYAHVVDSNLKEASDANPFSKIKREKNNDK